MESSFEHDLINLSISSVSISNAVKTVHATISTSSFFASLIVILITIAIYKYRKAIINTNNSKHIIPTKQ